MAFTNIAPETIVTLCEPLTQHRSRILKPELLPFHLTLASQKDEQISKKTVHKVVFTFLQNLKVKMFSRDRILVNLALKNSLSLILILTILGQRGEVLLYRGQKLRNANLQATKKTS